MTPYRNLLNGKLALIFKMLLYALLVLLPGSSIFPISCHAMVTVDTDTCSSIKSDWPVATIDNIQSALDEAFAMAKTIVYAMDRGAKSSLLKPRVKYITQAFLACEPGDEVCQAARGVIHWQERRR